MVKFDNTTKDDSESNGDQEELLSPPQPSSPSSVARETKVTNGCSQAEDEEEPLLQGNQQPVTINKTAKMQNGEIIIPIHITSDRLSVNTAATASIHSSPSHCLNNEKDQTVINPSILQNVERPTVHDPPHDEVVAIQMTSPTCRDAHHESPRSDYGGFECKWQTMCGPNPKKISLIILVILSIWASFILGLNVYKQVSQLESNLESMSLKVHRLQDSYLQMHDKATNEIVVLKSHIQELQKQNQRSSPMSSSRRHHERNGKSLELTRPEHSSESYLKQEQTEKPEQTTDVKQVSSRSSTSVAPFRNETRADDCVTVEGVKCIFPFKFNGETMKTCVQRWIDFKPWCPTKLDDSGSVIRFDNTAWGNCQESCPVN